MHTGCRHRRLAVAALSELNCMFVATATAHSVVPLAGPMFLSNCPQCLLECAMSSLPKPTHNCPILPSSAIPCTLHSSSGRLCVSTRQLDLHMPESRPHVTNQQSCRAAAEPLQPAEALWLNSPSTRCCLPACRRQASAAFGWQWTQ